LKIKISNFQSIKSARLYFPQGVTTIVGPSNSGKTSIIRALTCVLTNSSDAKSFIKHGEDKTEVTLNDDKLNVTWSRTTKGSFYEIKGELHQKVGKTDLFDLVEDTGFLRDDEGNIINIQDEWSILFPFDRNPAQMYKLFESTFSINNSSEVLKYIKDDETSRRRLITGHSTELKKNTDKLSKVTQFIEENPLQSLHKKKEELTQIAIKYTSMNNDMNIVTEGIKTLNKLKTLERKQFDLSGMSKLVSLDKDIKYIDGYEKVANFNEEIVRFDLSGIDKLGDIDKDIKYIESNSKLIDLDIPIQRFDFSKISNLNELNHDLEDLAKLIGSHQKLKENIRIATDKKIELEKKLSSIKVCPLCSQSISKGVA